MLGMTGSETSGGHKLKSDGFPVFSRHNREISRDGFASDYNHRHSINTPLKAGYLLNVETVGMWNTCSRRLPRVRQICREQI